MVHLYSELHSNAVKTSQTRFSIPKMLSGKMLGGLIYKFCRLSRIVGGARAPPAPPVPAPLSQQSTGPSKAIFQIFFQIFEKFRLEGTWSPKILTQILKKSKKNQIFLQQIILFLPGYEFYIFSAFF